MAYGPTAILQGITYSEWTARWWKWALETPRKRNPLIDSTGKWSAENQSYSKTVWFLAGSLVGLMERVERYCTIPTGRAILFPVSNNESSFIEFPNLRTESQLREASKVDIDKVTKLKVAIDGLALRESQLKKYRIQSPLFTIDLPEDNILEKPPGKTLAVSDGYWMFLKPLHKGTHIINFLGSCATDALYIEAKYDVEVR